MSRSESMMENSSYVILLSHHLVSVFLCEQELGVTHRPPRPQSTEHSEENNDEPPLCSERRVSAADLMCANNKTKYIAVTEEQSWNWSELDWNHPHNTPPPTPICISSPLRSTQSRATHNTTPVFRLLLSQ